MRQKRSLRRGFTLVELLASLAVTTIGISVLAVAGGSTAQPPKEDPPPPAVDPDMERILKSLNHMQDELAGIRSRMEVLDSNLKETTEMLTARNPAMRAKARLLKDSTQVRGIMQAFVIWGQNNEDHYVLPSTMDTWDSTVDGPLASKDTSAAIFSILIFNGFITPELCVSPAEANRNISVCRTFEYNSPQRGKIPRQAMWDPGFNVDFTGGKTGSLSYGHLQPSQGRRGGWSNTFNAKGAVVGNRGPEIVSVAHPKGGEPVANAKLASSMTYLIHGPRDSWEGNIAYNDAHVEFQDKMVSDDAAAWPAYTRADGSSVGDCLFFDERDDPAGSNAFLGIFTAAGEKAQDWKAIWD